jgi:ABC-2 type transport system permease protein
MAVHIAALSIIGYAFLVILMLILYYDLMVILRTLPFFLIQATSVEKLEGEVINLCFKIPGTLFKGAFKVIFCLILPYGIMATVPTQFFIGTLTPLGLLYSICVVVGFTIFSLFFWKFGLRCYKSASS